MTVPPAPLPVEVVPLSALKPHPRNYRVHPEDELDHLAESIRANGIYRNIVVAEENTILAGHGVVLALTRLGLPAAPVTRLPLPPDHPQALKVLTGDNEIGHLTETDDRALSELLRAIQEADSAGGLLGTGYDDAMLANLVFVTRPASEIQSMDEAAHWVGMPDFEHTPQPYTILINCASEADQAAFLATLGNPVTTNRGRVRSLTWPLTERRDLASVRFEVPDAPE